MKRQSILIQKMLIYIGEVPSPCTNNETAWRYLGQARCPEKNAFVLLLVAIYMMVTNILLVNLLIAMFR